MIVSNNFLQFLIRKRQLDDWYLLCTCMSNVTNWSSPPKRSTHSPRTGRSWWSCCARGPSASGSSNRASSTRCSDLTRGAGITRWTRWTCNRSNTYIIVVFNEPFDTAHFGDDANRSAMTSFPSYTVKDCMVFTALHGMQTRSSHEKGVCPSVCPSACPSLKSRGLWQNGRKICPDFYTIRKNI